MTETRLFYLIHSFEDKEDHNEMLDFYTDIDNEGFEWAGDCGVDIIPVTHAVTGPLSPALKDVVFELKTTYQFDIDDCYLYWMSINSFIPIDNSRKDYDLTLLYFLEYNNGYSRLFLEGDTNATDVWKQVVFPPLKGGDAIMIPSHVKFGFTRHHHPDLMKVLRVNLKMTPLTN